MGTQYETQYKGGETPTIFHHNETEIVIFSGFFVKSQKYGCPIDTLRGSNSTTVIVGVLYPRNVHPKVRGGTEYRQ